MANFGVVKKITDFVKKETVLTIAWILAIISAFIVHPSKAYIDYIDFKSLGTLWCLMIVVAGLSKSGVFSFIGDRLLSKVKYVWQLVFVLVMMPFFFSMFITNDVSLLTFVPFAIYILKSSGQKKLLIPVIVMQTLAANLGSMFTPVGNPQNLYLYGLSGLSVIGFIKLMLPYSLMSLVMLLVGMFFIKNRGATISNGITNDGAVLNDITQTKDDMVNTNEASMGTGANAIVKIIVYLILFVLSLVSVTSQAIIPYWSLGLVVLIVVFVMDRKLLLSIDYALLFTFVGFFIFTGNLGNIEIIRNAMISMVDGHEMIAGVLSSQLISNVPAALLLSGFTENIAPLIVGVNLGGLGTLIASMASLISYKLLAHEYNELKGKYFVRFTVANVIFLIILVIEYYLIQTFA